MREPESWCLCRRCREFGLAEKNIVERVGWIVAPWRFRNAFIIERRETKGNINLKTHLVTWGATRLSTSTGLLEAVAGLLEAVAAIGEVVTASWLELSWVANAASFNQRLHLEFMLNENEKPAQSAATEENLQLRSLGRDGSDQLKLPLGLRKSYAAFIKCVGMDKPWFVFFLIYDHRWNLLRKWWSKCSISHLPHRWGQLSKPENNNKYISNKISNMIKWKHEWTKVSVN